MPRTFRTAPRRLLALAGALTLLAAPAGARADIYKYVDEHGVVHLADRPGGPGWKLIVKGKRRVAPLRTPDLGYRHNRRRYSPLIDRVARHYRLDRALVHAVIKAESSYNPSAVSRKGAVGLMQLMPGTAQRYGASDRYDPAQNVKAGVRYLRDLIVHFNDVVLALAAYNAGENAVKRYGNRVPPYAETREYVRRVLAYYRELRSVSG